MDKSIAKGAHPGSTYPEERHGNTAVPFAIEDWLPAMPGRQVLVTGVNEDQASGRVNLLIQKIRRHDLRAYDLRANLDKSREQDALWDRPITTDFKIGDPYTLAYDSGRFDLVICAFLSTGAEIKSETLQEISRVIRPDGHLLIIDNLVPGSRLRGKKARQLRLAGEWVNTWMRLRKSQHKRFLGQDAWTQLLADAQWTIQQMATDETAQDFDTWADCYSPTANNRIRLRAMLLQAPEKVHRFLTPLESGDRIAFRMIEVFILATKDTG